MKRVIVLGCAGSGKSTFSQRLGEALGLPVVHLDSLYWKPGWIAAPNEQWDAIVEQVTKPDEWIIDGNYSRTLDMRLKRSDTVIFFDFPRMLCLYRVIKRRIVYRGRTRPDMGPGCREQLDPAFLRWIWNFRKRNRPKLLEKLEQVRERQTVIIFKSPKEVKAFLESVKPR